MATAYTVYCDASGHPADNSILIVSGFVSTADKWSRFEAQWTQLLEKFHVPSLHMKEFTQCRGQFGGWDSNRQKDFLVQAIPIIKTNTNKSFSAGVVVQDLKRLHDEYHIPSDLEFRSPYGWCAMTLCTRVIAWMERNLKPHDPVQFVFEDGDKDRGKFLIRAKEAFGFSPTFADKRTCVPLQAADLLAWEHRRFAVDKESEQRRPHRRSLVALYNQIPHDGSWAFSRWKSMEKGCQALGFPRRNESDKN